MSEHQEVFVLLFEEGAYEDAFSEAVAVLPNESYAADMVEYLNEAWADYRREKNYRRPVRDFRYEKALLKPSPDDLWTSLVAEAERDFGRSRKAETP